MKYIYDKNLACMVDAETGEPTGSIGRPLNLNKRVNFVRDYAPYDCPITGREIVGRREHHENLQRHGVRVIEKGETREAAGNRAAAEEARLRQIDRAVNEIAASVEVS